LRIPVQDVQTGRGHQMQTKYNLLRTFMLCADYIMLYLQSLSVYKTFRFSILWHEKSNPSPQQAAFMIY